MRITQIEVLIQLSAERYGDGIPDPKVFVYAAGGYTILTGDDDRFVAIALMHRRDD
jgi:hypothetical protein